MSARKLKLSVHDRVANIEARADLVFDSASTKQQVFEHNKPSELQNTPTTLSEQGIVAKARQDGVRILSHGDGLLLIPTSAATAVKKLRDNLNQEHDRAISAISLNLGTFDVNAEGDPHDELNETDDTELHNSLGEEMVGDVTEVSSVREYSRGFSDSQASPRSSTPAWFPAKPIVPKQNQIILKRLPDSSQFAYRICAMTNDMAPTLAIPPSCFDSQCPSLYDALDGLQDWDNGSVAPPSSPRLDVIAESGTDSDADDMISVDALDCDRAAEIQHEEANEFGSDSKQSMNLLVSMGHSQQDPEAIAALFHEGSVDKKSIGDFLGEPGALHQAVLAAYLDCMCFAGMPIDLALRRFLSGFRLPGEAQKIDRMMLKFAARYAAETEAFRSTDTAYVLAYSIVMLNTDAHSPHVAKKMTKEEFVRNNRGIDGGDDLPGELLEGIYDRIVAKGFTVALDSGDLCDDSDEEAGPARLRKSRSEDVRGGAQGLLQRAASTQARWAAAARLRVRAGSRIFRYYSW